MRPALFLLSVVLILASCQGMYIPTVPVSETLAPTITISPTPSPTRVEVTQTMRVEITSTPTPLVGITCDVHTGYETGMLNLRTGPGITHSVIFWLQEGETITVTSQSLGGAWLNITTQNDINGWINSSFCEVRNGR